MAHVKVLLKENVDNLGDVGDLVNVRSGYARNFLLPKDIAILPTVGELKRFQKKRALLEKQRQEEKASAEELAKKIEKIKKIEIFAKAGETGKLFGSITTKEIAERIKDETDVDIPRKQILLRKGITEVGEHNIKIKLHSEVSTEIRVVIKPEE